MKLYYCETTNPRKVCALAKHLKLPLEYQRVDLFRREQDQPEFGAINPNRKVPVLVDDSTTIFESTAILVYLAGAAGSDLWPSEAKSQAEVLQWLAWDSGHLSRHAGTVYFEHYIKPLASLGDPDSAAVDEAVGFFRRFAQVLDDHLSRVSNVACNRLTIADFGVACVMTVARESELTQLPVGEFANVTRWLDDMAALPAWREPWPA